MEQAVLEMTDKTFVEVSEVWIPEGDKLVLAGGDYGPHEAFAAASGKESFAKGEGLPGKAWAEERPIVLKEFDGSYFKRTDAARAAGLTAAIAIPVFKRGKLLAVLVTLCADDDERVGAIEVWSEDGGVLRLADGYYGAAKHFEWVSQHTQFPRGQGLPGGVWAAKTPMLMRNLGSGYKFIRAESAGKAGLTNGLGVPIPVPGGGRFVVTLLSARGTPLASRFEIWDARHAKVGATGGAVLIDGICAKEGPLWDEDAPRRVAAWKGHIGKVVGNGLPVAGRDLPGMPAGYRSFVALPIHGDDGLSHVVAWYC